MSKRQQMEAAVKKLRESMFPHLRRTVEGGSDHLRGKNEQGQMRAIQAKDPEGKPRKKGGLSKHYD